MSKQASVRRASGGGPGRAWIALAAAVGLLAGGSRPAAGTEMAGYLGQFVLMMDWVSRSAAWVPRHSDDHALADVAHAVAETLVEKAQFLTPPAELRDLHPHFLLVLENAERAFHFLSQGESERAERHLAIVRDETRLMRQLARELGVEIPELNP